jgi:hypothetical protein
VAGLKRCAIPAAAEGNNALAKAEMPCCVKIDAMAADALSGRKENHKQPAP